MQRESKHKPETIALMKVKRALRTEESEQKRSKGIKNSWTPERRKKHSDNMKAIRAKKFWNKEGFKN